jgi:folate-binding protein YgfZ
MRAAFLHGQLTQDVQHLQPGQARLAGYCSPKGRLLASFVMWPQADDEVLLACSADLLPPTLKRLSMFVLRAKCKLDDAAADWALWGLAGATALQAVRQPVALGAAPGRRQRAAAPARCTGRRPAPWRVRCWRSRRRQLAPAAPALAAEAWLALEAASGVPRIVAATVEQFVPQMVNLELVGGVNFQKGCYPGQEVVARSQYRGTLKRRAFAVQADGPWRQVRRSSTAKTRSSRRAWWRWRVAFPTVDTRR